MQKPTPHELAPSFLGARTWSTGQLRSRGIGKKRIRELIAAGRLTRVRTGRYVSSDVHARLVAAARLGGRLGCVSLLAAVGIFVREHEDLHIQIERGASRLPSRSPGIVAHWRVADGCSRDALATGITDALVEAVLCQAPRDAVATLDSAWHHGLVDENDIGEVFHRLPRRYQALRTLLDRRSEAGTETLMRLLLRALGHHVEVQVRIPGVGRVDLVVDGWLIVECDSREFHDDWSVRRKDVRRDLAAARLGYTTVRPLAEDILYAHDEMVNAMREILSHPRIGVPTAYRPELLQSRTEQPRTGGRGRGTAPAGGVRDRRA
ncbi:hypothetical protein [Microbacterium sp.]|uniref:hypothetical protein n=1 Tax=Microbacterium sp. TaxID=51671 RepID=UPI003C7852D2